METYTSIVNFMQSGGFFMYPIAETDAGRLDSYAPDDFKYQISAREVQA